MLITTPLEVVISPDGHDILYLGEKLGGTQGGEKSEAFAHLFAAAPALYALLQRAEAILELARSEARSPETGELLKKCFCGGSVPLQYNFCGACGAEVVGAPSWVALDMERIDDELDLIRGQINPLKLNGHYSVNTDASRWRKEWRFRNYKEGAE